MKIIIEKDAATKLQKEVADLDEARGYAESGFHVSVESEDGTYAPLVDVLAALEPFAEEVEEELASPDAPKVPKPNAATKTPAKKKK